MNVDWIKWMSFCVNEFEVDVNDSVFPDNEQQKLYYYNRVDHNFRPVYIFKQYILTIYRFKSTQ